MENKKRYLGTPLGREMRRRYEKSPRGSEARYRYEQSEKGKSAKAERDARYYSRNRDLVRQRQKDYYERTKQ